MRRQIEIVHPNRMRATGSLPDNASRQVVVAYTGRNVLDCRVVGAVGTDRIVVGEKRGVGMHVGASG
jgi:hypothetical protein